MLCFELFTTSILTLLDFPGFKVNKVSFTDIPLGKFTSSSGSNRTGVAISTGP